MIRRTPLKRSAKPIPKRRAKPRRGPLRDPGYRKWLRETRNCSVLNSIGNIDDPNGCIPWPLIDPAHTVNNGMRSKGPDSSCAPLCRRHHMEYDAGRKTFENKYDVDMASEAAAHYRVYQIAVKGE